MYWASSRFRALQKQRHELQRRWAESHQQALQRLDGNICRSTDAVMSIQFGRVKPSKSITLHTPPKGPGIHAANRSIGVEMDMLFRALNEEYRPRNSKYHQPYLIVSFQAPKWMPFTRRVLDIKSHELTVGWSFYSRLTT